jgi:outer membrane protein OmpA-like peptidoglycan-associated protein
MYYDDEDEDEHGSRGKHVALAGLLVIGGWFGYQKVSGSNEQVGVQLDPPATSTVPPTTLLGISDVSSGSSTTAPVLTTIGPTTDPARALVRPSTTAVISTTTGPAPTTPASAPAPTTPATTSVAPAPTSVAPAAPGSILPNGIAIGAFVTFDGEAVTMSGALPTERARDRLLMLVTAANVNDKPIVNNVTIDPSAPGGDSVRVIGLDPRAFPEGTHDIHPPHAVELDRLATLFNAFPDVTIVVVGRADQRGPAERNLDVAEARADALVTYLVGRGVAPERLSSVTFGEAQPTMPEHNVVAFSLNRRAEFVLYGLTG